MKKISIWVILAYFFFIVGSAFAETEFEKTKKAAEHGDAHAQYYLGLLYRQGSGIEKDFEKALYWYTKAAEQGHMEAQRSLGVMYSSERAKFQDHQKSIYWYTKAADQGDNKAQYDLGFIYYTEHIVPKNDVKAFYWFKKSAEQGNHSARNVIAAEKGDAYAQYKLGRVFKIGIVGGLLIQDFKKAIHWYTKSADQGYAKAQYELGSIYSGSGFYDQDLGKTVYQDLQKAIYWYTKAAEQGHKKAQFSLGLAYDSDREGYKDYGKAAFWYKKAAEQGEAGAQSMLGFKYVYGNGVIKDYQKAAKWFAKAAEQGYETAQNQLGLLHRDGLCNPQDFKKAYYWFSKAAEKGHYEAIYNLGLLYYWGEGIPSDRKKALYLYKKATEQEKGGYAQKEIDAENGDVKAQNFLGDVYRIGLGRPQSKKKAAYWYKKAAEQGHAESQLNFGLLQYWGEGIPKDRKKAVYWYKKAAQHGDETAQQLIGAERGDTEAQYLVALLYEKEKKDPYEYKKAIHWYTQSAERGHPKAQIHLGYLYAQGEGVPQNYTMAYVWSSLAAAQGYKGAAQGYKGYRGAAGIRDKVESKLTPTLIAKAQELAARIQYRIDNPAQSMEPSESADSAMIAQQQTIGSGTGFLITKDGYIITCYHVTERAGSIVVWLNGKSYPAVPSRIDKHNDLALLKITGQFQALAFSSKRTAQMGQNVFTLGYPNPNIQGINAKLTKGSVNSLTGLQDDLRLYQVSIPVQPGNSGGPLLDMSGNVVGIIMAVLDAKNVFKYTGAIPQNVNYAIKSSYALALLDIMPEVADKLLPPSKSSSLDAVVERVSKSVVMILAYE